MKLGDLANDTEFSYRGYIFRKESTGWGFPSKPHPECTPEIEGKPSHKVTPKMGGQFQPAAAKWMADATEVSVSPDRF